MDYFNFGWRYVRKPSKQFIASEFAYAYYFGGSANGSKFLGGMDGTSPSSDIIFVCEVVHSGDASSLWVCR